MGTCRWAVKVRSLSWGQSRRVLLVLRELNQLESTDWCPNVGSFGNSPNWVLFQDYDVSKVCILLYFYVFEFMELLE